MSAASLALVSAIVLAATTGGAGDHQAGPVPASGGAVIAQYGGTDFSPPQFTPTGAGRIYFNGTDVSNDRNKRYNNVNVVVDTKGDVYITTPTATQPQANAAAGMQKRYLLLTQFSQVRADYDIDIWINKKFYKRVLAHADQVADDITQLLVPGANKIAVQATKTTAYGAIPPPADAFVELLVGEGERSGPQVKMNKVLVSFRRTGDETQTFTKHYEINVY